MKRYIIFWQSNKLYQGETIKKQDILHIVSEISETLSLTNEPRQLFETTLDTLSEVLNTDCCWIQLVNISSDRLSLAASRGFTPDIQREMASINTGHRFSQEIVGFGHKITIPNLSHDNNHDLSVFEKAGFCSLIAVPVMTYRIHGVLGVAYRVRKKLDDDFSNLIAVIANLIGMAFNKFRLNQQPVEKPNQLSMSQPFRLETIVISRDTRSVAVESGDTVDIGRRDESETKRHNGDFHDHVRRMRAFIGSHKLR